MKLKKLSLFIAFFLAACAPAVQAPTPTATSIPTTTPTPPPTITPTSTPEAWLAIAEEYGMPAEQAQKLAGMNVTFEQWTKNVDGVLVKNEAGQDAFWYDPQTEFLVAVDRWPVVTDVYEFGKNQITEQEILSDEFFAWVKYLVSKTEKGIGPDENIFPNVTKAGKMIKLKSSNGATELVNYPGLVNEGVIYADLKTGANYDNKEYRVVVSAYEYQGKKYPLILIGKYTSIYGTDEVRAKGLKMFASMTRRPIMTGHNHDFDGSIDLFAKDSQSSMGSGGMESAMEKLEQGDPTLVSQPGVVYLTLLGEGKFYGNTIK